MKKRGYNTTEAANYIGLSESLLRQARMASKDIDAPKHTKLSCRKIIYLLEDLDKWLDSQVANSTGKKAVEDEAR